VSDSSVSKDVFGSANVPIYQTATFDCRDQNSYDYTRSGNPTRHALEKLCASIEKGEHAFAFTSGMSALTSVLRMLVPGQTVLACEDIYGGMHRQLLHACRSSGIKVEFVKTWENKLVEEAFRKFPGIAMVCLESPTNPQMRVTDIRAVTRIAHGNNAIVSVDNSIMSPILMSPLELGADLVVHSATKFLSGHSDVMAGVVICNDNEIAKKVSFIQNAEGNGLAPFDSWLVLRGMKTLALRVQAAQSNALQVYEYLCNHPCVPSVNYLRPPDASLHISKKTESTKRGFRNPHWNQEVQLHFSQAHGGGSVLSFEMRTPEASQSVVKHTKLFKNTVSFGSCSSLIEIPSLMSHASIPLEQQTMSPALIRLSVGIEDVSDLIFDLGQAISQADIDSSPLERSTSSSFPLGQTLPPLDEHAVGVSMPLWNDVVAYEEGDPSTHAKLAGGYPRFVFLHSVRQLFAKAESLFADKNTEQAMVFPSARVALRFQQFLNTPGVNVHDCFAHGVFAVTFPKELADTAKKFWQHTGEIISSRQSAAVLEVIERTCYENAQDKKDPAEPEVFRQPHSSSHSSRTSLKKRIGTLMCADSADVFLYPTGMAAVSAMQRLLKLISQWESKPLKTVVFGFPYLDTLKLAQLPFVGSGGVHFFGIGDEKDFADLTELLQREKISGLFCEFPSNPLLKAPDLVRLRSLGDEYGFPVIVDDSIVGCCNVNLLTKGGADVVVSSLTKQFSGSGNVMGGSLVLNPHSRFHEVFRSRMMRDHEETLLWHEDADVLLKSSADLESRVAQSNRSTAAIVKELAIHPRIKSVYHPLLENKELYDRFKRDAPYAGYGSMFSLEFKNPEHSKRFYDHLDLPKGPGFGTGFSLVCPYTVIAHYHELEWAAAYGVDANLVRVWIGQEDDRELLAKFHVAMDTCCDI